MNIDIETSKNKFLERLQEGYFEVERSQNTEDVYSATKEKRDTDAVEAFMSTDLAKDIMKMK